MNQDQLFRQFVDKLRGEKSEEEVKRFLENLMNFSAAEVYFTIVANLTEQDLQEIEQIENETLAEQEVLNRFKSRTGVSPKEFVDRLKEEIAKGYLNSP